jgi:ubiquinone biosynthesis protein
MGLAAGLAERCAPDARRLEPRTLAASVIESVRRELDLRLEAAGADELRAVMAKDRAACRRRRWSGKASADAF